MRHHGPSLTRLLLFVVFCCLGAAINVPAVQIKLTSGATFTGDIVSQNDNFIVLKVGEARVSIAKQMVAEITGLPQAPAAAGTPPANKAAEVAPAPPAPPQEAAAPAADVQGLAPGKSVAITLKNGVVFKGAIVSVDERLIVLEAENGSRVNVYRHIVADIRDLNAPAAPSPHAAPSVTAAPADAPPVPPAVTPKHELASAAAAPGAPAATQQPPSSAPAAPTAVTPVPSAPAPAQTSPAAVVPAAVQPAAAAPIPPASVASVKTAPPAVSVPAAPSAPAPVQSAPAAAPRAVLPPPAAPKKRPDGKTELVLKNGTAFIGTIVSEGDRFLAFTTADGATINILRRLIKEIDGVPYAVVPGASVVPIDTLSLMQRASGAPAAPAPEPQADTAAVGADNVLRLVPRVEMKAGVSPTVLIDSLKSNSRDQRALAARQLGGMGQWASGGIPALAAMLADTVGAYEYPPFQTDSASIQKLLSPGYEAARALARMGPQGAEELKNGVRSGDAVKRQRAVFGLGVMHNAADIPLLKEAIKDQEPRVRALAAYGLRFKEAGQTLIAALGDRDGDVRTFAAATIGRMRSVEAEKALLAALKDVRPSVRVQAAIALGNRGSKEAVAPLAAALTDMSSEVREKSAAALGAIGDTAAVTPMLAVLQDQNPFVRKSAVEALSAIRDPRAIPSLYSALQDKNDTVRIAVEAALRQHTEIPLLIAALDNKNPLTRENAAYILWLMTGRDLGQDKQAWLAWSNSQGTAAAPPKKNAPPPAAAKKETKKGSGKKP